MFAAEAQVKTEDPRRYLTQLCRHAQQVHRLRHRPRSHGGDGQPPPKVQHFSEPLAVFHHASIAANVYGQSFGAQAV